MKVYLYYIGKPRDSHANAMAADFVARATRFCACAMREPRPDRADPWAKHPAARHILLDPAGRAMDTAAGATLPHELARVLLAEQIYRALATLRGHPYPR